MTAPEENENSVGRSAIAAVLPAVWSRACRAPTPVILIYLTALVNAIYAAVFFCFWYSALFGSVWLCYVLIMPTMIASFTGILPYFFKPAGRGNLFVAVAIHAASNIFVFASVYRGFGLKCMPYVEWTDALYFSTVTWTTLGYGDLLPHHDIRMIAAIEALFGYVYFGLMVGIIGSSLGGKSNKP